MSTSTRNHSKVRHAVLWLSTRELYVGLRSSDDTTIEIHYVEWNPDNVVLHSEEAKSLLTSALQSLVRKLSLHRLRVRLCLDDALCVTRVVMGERESVDRELESIQSRSQLYLSLGLGEKVTGNLRQSMPGQVSYALTSIVNQRTMLAICESIRAARINLDAIEPVTLSITRAFGFLGLDSSQPILFATVDQNQCSLAISRSGKPMLSYRINGQSEPAAWAMQIASHLVRLGRFCQRYRLQDRSPLECIYVLGNSEQVDALTASLQTTTDRLKIASTNLLAEGMFASQSAVPRIVELVCWGVLEAEENRSDGLPPPDLHNQLLKLQSKPLGVQLVRAFWPATVAAMLCLIMLGAQWQYRRSLKQRMDELAEITANLSLAEQELSELQSKEMLLQYSEQHRIALQEPSWVGLIESLAPCLPANVRLEGLSLGDRKNIVLRGVMYSGDHTYELLMALKQLPVIGEVSVESVSPMGDFGSNQLQFEIRCRLRQSFETDPAQHGSIERLVSKQK